MTPKKPYGRPALTKWGRLIDLTRTDWAALEGDLKMGTLNIRILEGRRTRNRHALDGIDLPLGTRSHLR